MLVVVGPRDSGYGGDAFSVLERGGGPGGDIDDGANNNINLVFSRQTNW